MNRFVEMNKLSINIGIKLSTFDSTPRPSASTSCCKRWEIYHHLIHFNWYNQNFFIYLINLSK